MRASAVQLIHDLCTLGATYSSKSCFCQHASIAMILAQLPCVHRLIDRPMCRSVQVTQRLCKCRAAVLSQSWRGSVQHGPDSARAIAASSSDLRSQANLRCGFCVMQSAPQPAGALGDQHMGAQHPWRRSITIKWGQNVVVWL